MKKLFLLCTMCLMAKTMVVSPSCTKEGEGNGEEVSGKYVDLGLPSGTKWKDCNESVGDFNLYSYDQAISNFGDKLPNKEQFEELQHSCMWTWHGDGYKVVGPNGKYIVLPASGYHDCGGDVDIVWSLGFYWSSTPNGSGNAWYLYFDSDGVRMIYGNRCDGFSVRLVQD